MTSRMDAITARLAAISGASAHEDIQIQVGVSVLVEPQIASCMREMRATWWPASRPEQPHALEVSRQASVPFDEMRKRSQYSANRCRSFSLSRPKSSRE